MPRAATSVATQTCERPSRIDCSAFDRSDCAISPDSDTTEKPRLASRAVRWRTASRVWQNTSALVLSESSSALMMACSRSSRRTSISWYSMSACCSVDAVAVDAHRVLLEGLGQFGDAARHGRRKHQRAAFARRGAEDEFEIVAKAEVQHLVGFVEHHRAQSR